ncbi:Tn3 family transposase [Streptomyces sp. NPDC054840]
MGALGMALNAIVWWNTLYMDAAGKEVEAGGLTISQEIRSRLSPLAHGHINFHGRYPIVRSHGDGSLRPLRDPGASERVFDRGFPPTVRLLLWQCGLVSMIS